MTTNENGFSHLDDRPLLDVAKRLASEERRVTAVLLRALMEIETRRLYLGESCASMFTYCTQVLHMAEGAAYNRIEAARVARRCPIILDFSSSPQSRSWRCGNGGEYPATLPRAQSL